MQTRKQKEELIKELSENVGASKTVVVCDFKGLTVANMTELRKKLREKSIAMQVIKKTLANLAFKEAKVDLDVKNLEGQVAIVYGGEDEISSPKTLAEFAKTNKNFSILAGALEGKALDKEGVNNLAKLPSKEEMLARCVGTIQAPISSFVNVLAGNLRNLVYVVNAIKSSKEEAK